MTIIDCGTWVINDEFSTPDNLFESEKEMLEKFSDPNTVQGALTRVLCGRRFLDLPLDDMAHFAIAIPREIALGLRAWLATRPDPIPLPDGVKDYSGGKMPMLWHSVNDLIAFLLQASIWDQDGDLWLFNSEAALTDIAAWLVAGEHDTLFRFPPKLHGMEVWK